MVCRCKVNITKNCIDRHLQKGDKTAIILNQMTQGRSLHISYTELHQRVCKMANVLREQGTKRRSYAYIYQ
jgi:acetyl-CoA synthetase